MKFSQFKSSSVYFSFLVIYWFLLGLLVAIKGYQGSFLLLNALHQPWLDYPMFVLTHLGDALILTSIVALFLSRTRPDVVIQMILAVIVIGLFGQLLKNTWFTDFDRPLRVFADIAQVHTVAGYKMYHNSFPSGHSIVVAAVLTTFVVNIAVSRWQQMLLAMAVMLISYTRIYVGVHFAGDVLAGSILGAIGAMLLSVWWAAPLNRWTTRMNAKRLVQMKVFLIVLAVVSFIAGILMLVMFLN